MVVSGIYRGRLMNANVGCQETVIVDERGRGKKKKGRSEGRDGTVLGVPLCLRWSEGQAISLPWQPGLATCAN